MSRYRAAAFALLALTAACGASSHRADVLQVGSTPAGATTPPATLAPTTEPTVVASPTRRPATASPTPPARSAAPAAPPPVPTTSPTPADTRPTATVVVVNHASMTVDVIVGDLTFRLASGQASARRTAHVDPGGNTGVGANRSDDPGCGYGGPKYLRPGYSYTLTLKDGGRCTHNGTRAPSPYGTLTEP